MKNAVHGFALMFAAVSSDSLQLFFLEVSTHDFFSSRLGLGEWDVEF
jgi:hypothetical protein